jgi:glutaredoxin
MQVPEHKVEIFSRVNCHLCDEAKQLLQAVARDIPFELTSHDVDTNPDWQRLYGAEVPVVLINGRKRFKFRIDEKSLRRALTARR